jgi:hypothetical protein
VREDQQVNEHDILGRVRELVELERDLRARTTAGDLDPAAEKEQLRDVEVALDQCWDLLRQRRAQSEFGEDPDQARSRPAEQVEKYLQ